MENLLGVWVVDHQCSRKYGYVVLVRIDVKVNIKKEKKENHIYIKKKFTQSRKIWTNGKVGNKCRPSWKNQEGVGRFIFYNWNDLVPWKTRNQKILMAWNFAQILEAGGYEGT